MVWYNNSLIHILVACIIPNIGGFIGSLFTSTDSSSWYGQLNRPSFSPPTWLFFPAWTTLYILMGFASYRVWRVGGGFCGEAKVPLIMYALQLVLNWIWTPIFFIAKALGWAFVEMVILWVVVVATAVLFFRIDKFAGILLVPYIAWITFAAVLNYSYWYLN